MRPEEMAGGEAYSVSTWKSYAAFRWSMDTLRSALDGDGVGLVAPVEDPVWADIRGLVVAKSLKMNLDGAECRGACMGRSFPM